MKNWKVKPWTIAGTFILVALFAAYFYWWRIDFPSPLSRITK